MKFLRTVVNRLLARPRPVKRTLDDAPPLPKAEALFASSDQTLDFPAVRPRRLRRRPIGAFVDAMFAVLAGMPLLMFLEHRLADYLAEAPLVTSPFPTFVIDPEKGLLGLTWPADRRHPAARVLDDPSSDADDSEASHDPAAAETQWFRVTRQAFTDALSPQLERAHAAAGQLQREQRDLAERQERAEHEQKSALEAQVTLSKGDPRDVDAEGRDAPISAASRSRLRLFACLIVLMEATAAFVPFADLAGIDVGALDLAWQSNRIGIVLWSAFSLTWAALLIYMTKVAAAGINKIVRYPGVRRVALLHLVGYLMMLAGVVGAAWTIATIRQNTAAGAVAIHDGAQPGTQGFALSHSAFLIFALVPIVGAAVLHLQIERAALADADARPSPLEAIAALREVLRRDAEGLLMREDVVLGRLARFSAAAHLAEQQMRAVGQRHDLIMTRFVADVARAIARDAFAFRIAARRKPDLLPSIERPTAVVALRGARRAS